MLSKAQEGIDPFQRFPTYSIAEQFTLKELMRGVSKAFSNSNMNVSTCPLLMGTNCATLVADLFLLSPTFSKKSQGTLYLAFHPSVLFQVVDTLCLQLFLQFYFDSFETLQVFMSWSEDVHIVWM